MSGKSKKSSKSKKASKARTDGPLDRPFDPDIVKRAEAIVRPYRIILENDGHGGLIGSTVELPGVFGEGETPDKCVGDTHQALIGAVAHMLELGQHPPESAARTLQVNIRLTPEEKLVLGTAARRDGFKGLSDFVRAAAMERTRQTT